MIEFVVFVIVVSLGRRMIFEQRPFIFHLSTRVTIFLNTQCYHLHICVRINYVNTQQPFIHTAPNRLIKIVFHWRPRHVLRPFQVIFFTHLGWKTHSKFVHRKLTITGVLKCHLMTQWHLNNRC